MRTSYNTVSSFEAYVKITKYSGTLIRTVEGKKNKKKLCLITKKFHLHLTLERNWHKGSFSIFNTVRKSSRSLSRVREKKTAEHFLRDGAGMILLST